MGTYEPRGHDFNWFDFAEAWASAYQPAIAEERSGRRPYVELDQLNLEGLRSVLRDFHINNLRHGQKVCVWNVPRCEKCPLTDICNWYQGQLAAGKLAKEHVAK